MPSCHQCQSQFADYRELAQHIIENRKTHKNRKGKMWAHSYLIGKKSRELPQRVSLMPEEREAIAVNRESIKVELSGVNKIVSTICPNKRCGAKSREALPIEHVQNPLTWRIGDRIAKLCISCGR